MDVISDIVSNSEELTNKIAMSGLSLAQVREGLTSSIKEVCAAVGLEKRGPCRLASFLTSRFRPDELSRGFIKEWAKRFKSGEEWNYMDGKGKRIAEKLYPGLYGKKKEKVVNEQEDYKEEEDVDKGREGKDTDDDIARLEQIKEEVLNLIYEAKDIIQSKGQGNTYLRAYSYWIPHVIIALTREHEWGSGSIVCMEDTIEELKDDYYDEEIEEKIKTVVREAGFNIEKVGTNYQLLQEQYDDDDNYEEEDVRTGAERTYPGVVWSKDDIGMIDDLRSALSDALNEFEKSEESLESKLVDIIGSLEKYPSLGALETKWGIRDEGIRNHYIKPVRNALPLFKCLVTQEKAIELTNNLEALADDIYTLKSFDNIGEISDEIEEKKKVNEQDKEQEEEFEAELPEEDLTDELEEELPEEEEEPKEEVKPKEFDIEKEFIGSSGETFFYLNRIENEMGQEDLIIQDQEENSLLSANKQDMEESNPAEFILAAIDELDIEELATSIVVRYIVPWAEEKAQEEEEAMEGEEEYKEDMMGGDFEEFAEDEFKEYIIRDKKYRCALKERKEDFLVLIEKRRYILSKTTVGIFEDKSKLFEKMLSVSRES